VTFNHRARRRRAACGPHHRLPGEPSIHDHDNLEEAVIPDHNAILDDRDLRRMMDFRASV